MYKGTILIFSFCMNLLTGFKITSRQYNVNGDVTVQNGKIIITGFSYTGKAPDAFFYVGTTGSPSESGTRVQYPPGSDAPLGRQYREDKTYTDREDKTHTDWENKTYTDREDKTYTDREDKTYTDWENKTYTDREDKTYTDREDKTYTDWENKHIKTGRTNI
ncbi:uncharacterized protein LOC111704088 [Eurytemora carolleeae]|uniref:uncharacterized protein LOC111704088 n=1 Tax=Eurytemora carolleeae TaxID=1294199 RepID=UPI000C7711BF|nr:uncharacterized protein LOC111704088 [Eurytemora carolleeae]|eukprot:XP_023331994.1 uncharacterized protein LOC111704088 [Eurytemora affinis]